MISASALPDCWFLPFEDVVMGGVEGWFLSCNFNFLGGARNFHSRR